MATLPQNASYVGVPAWQSVDDGKGAISGSFSVNQSTATEEWDIYQSQWQTFVAMILGYSVSGGRGGGIRRTLPRQHPQFVNMYASRVSNTQGIAPTGTSARMIDGGKAGALTAEWQLLRCTIQYETPSYLITPNVNAEWQRYLMLSVAPTVEFVQKRIGCFLFAAGTPGNGGKAIPDSGGSALIYSKTRLTFTWVQVPDFGLFEGGFGSGGRSLNIENGLAKVNLTTFMGYPPGTLLLEGWNPRPHYYPTTIPGNVGISARLWDVDLIISYFDPPTDPTFIATYPTAPRGHNLVPHPTNGYWYPAFSSSLPADAGGWATALGDTSWRYFRYQSYEYSNLFKMNS